MSSTQYKNKIRDYNDLDIVFSNLQKASIKNNDKIDEKLKLLVETLYSDIIKTRTESDRKNIDKIEVIFDEQTNELLSKIGGLSTVFERVKNIILKEISEGNIGQEYKEQLLKDVQTDLRKKLSIYRKQKNQNEQYQKITITESPSIKQLNDFSGKILHNEKLIETVSQKIKNTIRKQCTQQSKGVINFLTNNKYKEISLKVKKGNITNISSLTGKQAKLSVFEKATKLKNLFSYKNMLKVFKIKRPKLNKRGFIGLYNKYVYEQLMNRVSEFENVVNFKGKMGKTILKGVLKWGGGVLISGITGMLGFGWKTLKSAVKQIYNITKSVGKMGVSVLRKLKNFLFTGVGMFVIGFFSGIVYKAVIEPIYKKFKAWFDIALKPVKKWLGIGYEEDISIQELRVKVADKLKDSLKQELSGNGYINTIDKIEQLENFFDGIQDQLREIDMFMNGGGWKKAVGGAVAGNAGTIGTLVGMGIGSLICPGLGTWIGGAIGGAIGGFAASYTRNFVSKLPPTLDEDATRSNYTAELRNKWTGKNKIQSNDKKYKEHKRLTVHKNTKKQEIQDVDSRLSEISTMLDLAQKDNMLKLSDDQKKQLQDEYEALKRKKTEKENELGEIQKSIDANGYDDSEEKHEIVEKIKKNLDNKKVYFDVSGLEDISYFWKNAKDGKFQVKDETKDEISKLTTKEKDVYQIKKHAMMTALNKYDNGEITFETIYPFAYSYMKEMSKRDKVKVYKEQGYDVTTGSGGSLSKKVKYVEVLELDTSDYKGNEYVDNIWKKNLSDIWQMNQNLKYKDELHRKFLELYYNSGNITDNKERINYLRNEISRYADVLKNNEENQEKDSTEEFKETRKKASGEVKHAYAEAMIKAIKSLNKDSLTKEEEERFRKMADAHLGTTDKEIKQELDKGKVLESSIQTKRKEKTELKNSVEKDKKKRDELRAKHEEQMKKSKKPEQKIVHTTIPVIIEKDNDDITSANDEMYNYRTPYNGPSYTSSYGVNSIEKVIR